VVYLIDQYCLMFFNICDDLIGYDLGLDVVCLFDVVEVEDGVVSCADLILVYVMDFKNAERAFYHLHFGVD